MTPHSSPTASDTTDAGGHPRRWMILLALTGSLSMIFVDVTVSGVAGPTIAGEFGSGTDGVAWIANAYLVALAALMAIGGRLGDILGKRRAFEAGIVGFAAASAICGLAGSMEMLLLGRALQGVGAALMQPASSALVIECFAPGERGKAMGVYIGIPMTFFALGPVLGGLVTEHLGWRWVFFVNLPVAAMSLLLAFRAKPPNRPSPDRAIDLPSVAMLVTGLPLLVVSLQEGAHSDGAGSIRLLEPRSLAALAGGIALCILFAWRQLRAARPLVRLGLFRDRALLANTLLIAIMQFAMAGLVVEGSVYAQEVLLYDATKAGASLMPMLVPVIFLAQVAGRRYDRLGVRPLARIGTVCATAGFATWGVGCVATSYPVIALGMILLGAGVAFIMSPANTDALSRAPDELRGQVSGLLQTFRQAGGALGVAFAAAIATALEAFGQPLGTAIGGAMFGGALVAAVGVVVAWRMPSILPPRRG